MLEKKFYDYFPPPQFLEIPHAGLSIFDDSIRFIEFKRGKKSLEIEKYGKKELPPGFVIGGFIHKQQEVASLLKDFAKEHSLEYVKCMLPEEKTYLFKTEIPIVQPNEIRDVIEFKIEENVPIKTSEAIFDFDVIKRNGKYEHMGHIDVAVSVLPTKVVDVYVSILKSANLIPIAFDVESQSVTKAVIPSVNEDTYLIANLSCSKSGFYIVSKGVVQFTSSLSLSLSGIDTSAFKSTLKSEVEKMRDYWENHTESDENQKINKIIILMKEEGNTTLAHKIADFLGEDAEVAEVWTNAFSLNNYIPSISYESSLPYAASIGLAF